MPRRALVTCFLGAILVQAVLVAFYAAIALGLGLGVPLTHLAIVVPLSFIVQMLPLSVNGFGIREATFVVYFQQTRPAAGVGARAVVHRRRADHVVLHFRGRRLCHRTRARRLAPPASLP